MKEIEKVVDMLSSKFGDFKWSFRWDEGLKKYIILVNDFDFYMKDKNFKNWKKILRKKYKSTNFIFAYKNF